MTPVLRLCRPDDAYDPELLRIRDEDLPAVKVETEVGRRRKRARQGLFLPATPLPEIQAAASRLSTARALGLRLTIRAQARMEGKEWVRVRTHLLEAIGLGTTWARSRAYAELERAGLIEGEASKRLCPARAPRAAAGRRWSRGRRVACRSCRGRSRTARSDRPFTPSPPEPGAAARCSPADGAQLVPVPRSRTRCASSATA